MRYLPNPEQHWESPANTQSVDRKEMERRIGVTDAPLDVLSGGLANLNIHVGTTRVLRIYRRAPDAAKKEHALLTRGWGSFRVPKVLSAGEDFLLLEHVPHGPVEATAARGAAVGQALAEIHAFTYPTAGFLDAATAISRPLPDFVDALRSHIETQLDGSAAAWTHLRHPILQAISACAGPLRRLTDSPILLHGDFKASNLHWSLDEELLVLDWEFAYAGPALMDVGQLVRWTPSDLFCEAFADSYRSHGGTLPEDWRHWAGVLDLVNLVGLLGEADPGSQRASDVLRRIRETLDG